MKSIQEKLPLRLQGLLKIVGLNLKYSFNLITLIFIIVELSVILISLLVNTKLFDSSYDRMAMSIAIKNEYLKDSYFMVNLVTSVFVIGLPSLINRAFEKSMLTIKKREDIVISRIISGIILVGVLVLASGIMFVFIPSVSIKGFAINNEIIIYFIRLFLQLCFIYFISLILWELTENNLTIVGIAIIYFIILINNQNYIEINFFIKLTQKIFPVILLNGRNSMYLHGELYVLIYVFLEILIFRYIYLNKDIK